MNSKHFVVLYHISLAHKMHEEYYIVVLSQYQAYFGGTNQRSHLAMVRLHYLRTIRQQQLDHRDLVVRACERECVHIHQARWV